MILRNLELGMVREFRKEEENLVGFPSGTFQKLPFITSSRRFELKQGKSQMKTGFTWRREKLAQF
jgi:hypothetical protein